MDYCGVDYEKEFSLNYANHRPIVLSPDAIWLLISQSFSYHVNTNSDELRPMFLGHDGKSELTIRSSTDLLSEGADRDAILDMFSAKIASHTKGDVEEIFIQ
ncbi:MAG: DUF4419 domain-containing protein [Bacteroidales bacterium]|nr:DUF4419 domain-containing protein [Bacteroidales bacterium]